MRFFCIADKESSLGFRLAGIETREVFSKTDTLEALRVALAIDDLGIIIITEKAAVFIRQEIDELTYEREMPLILEIPSRGQERKAKSIGEFLKAALGVSI